MEPEGAEGSTSILESRGFLARLLLGLVVAESAWEFSETWSDVFSARQGFKYIQSWIIPDVSRSLGIILLPKYVLYQVICVKRKTEYLYLSYSACNNFVVLFWRRATILQHSSDHWKENNGNWLTTILQKQRKSKTHTKKILHELHVLNPRCRTFSPRKT